MRKAVAILLLGFVLAGTASAADTRVKPAVRLESMDPLVVTGTGFRAKEKVRVTVAVKRSTWRRNVVATRKGAFRAVIGLVQVGNCALSVRATGSKKSLATLKRAALPTCIP